MSTVAEQLRQAREARHLTVEQVAEITKIRTDHLRALEEGNFNVFSAPVYIRGFVRSLSTLLKLDVPRVMAELDTELGQTKRFAEPPALTAQPQGVLDLLMLQLSKFDWRRGALGLGVCVVLAAIIIGVFAWRHYRTTDHLKGVKPALYRSPSNTSGETLPLPPVKR